MLLRMWTVTTKQCGNNAKLHLSSLNIKLQHPIRHRGESLNETLQLQPVAYQRLIWLKHKGVQGEISGLYVQITFSIYRENGEPQP